MFPTIAKTRIATFGQMTTGLQGSRLSYLVTRKSKLASMVSCASLAVEN